MLTSETYTNTIIIMVSAFQVIVILTQLVQHYNMHILKQRQLICKTDLSAKLVRLKIP